MGITYNDIFESFTKDVLKNVDKNREEIKKDIVYIYPYEEFLDELHKFFIEIGAKEIDIAIHNVKFSRYIHLSLSHKKSEHILVELEHDMREWEEDSFYAYYQPPVENPSPNVYVSPMPHRFDILNDKNYKVSEYDSRRKWYPRTYGNLLELKKWIKSYYEWRTGKNKNSVVESFTNNVIKNVKNITQKEKRNDIIQIQFEDPEVEHICHEHGVYTIGDASKVTSIKGWFSNGDWDNKSIIKKFDELKYFTGLTSIEECTFRSCKSLQSVNIPNSVTIIGYSAFQSCESLQSVNIPNSVTSIEEKTFYRCHSLLSINIPNSVTSIGGYAFEGCKALHFINIPNSVTEIRNYAFEGCESLQSINIPNSVTSIGDQAFYWCITLQSIDIPNSVTSIGEFAFCYCKSLQSVNIPDSLLELGGYLRDIFYDCPLKIIYISKNNKFIKRFKAFAKKNNIQLVEPKVNESFTTGVINKTKSMTQEEKRADIAQIQFEDKEVEKICHEHDVYTYEDARKVTSIEEWFSENTTITSFDEFKYFTGLNKVEEFAFQNCKSLQSINIPSSVTSIGDGAFNWCLSLHSINIPNSVTSIGNGAFCGCKSLQSINIPNSVTSIGELAFYNCHYLQSVNIPNSVTSIGDSAFGNCKSLKSIVISKNCPVYDKIKDDYPSIQLVEPDVNESFTAGVINKAKTKTQEEKRADIAQIQFEDPEVERICHENGVYTIGDARNVNRINIRAYTSWFTDEPIRTFKEFKYFGLAGELETDTHAFASCNKLEYIELPSTIKRLNDNYFSYCTNLKTVIMPEGIEEIGKSLFLSCVNLEEFKFPSTVSKIGRYTFHYCHNLKKVYFPKNLQYIDMYNNTFDGCTSLEDLYIPSSVSDNIIEDIRKNLYKTKYDGFNTSKYQDIKIHIIDPNTEQDIEVFPISQKYYRSHKVDESFTSNVIKKTKETTQEEKRNDIIQIQFEDPEVERICHEHGVYTYADAKAVTSVQGWFKKTSHQGYPIVKFNEFKYFTGMTIIHKESFSFCRRLESIEIPRTVKKIGVLAFWACESLKHLNIPSSIKFLSRGSFGYCENIESITIPNSVTSIEVNEFYGCRLLKSITIPNSVTSIGECAFETCTSLTSINIPNSVTSIRDLTFRNCTSLQSINIPNSVTSIEVQAFYGCSSLQSINIPNSVTSIGWQTFCGCTSLKIINIPDSVTIIGDSAFDNCDSLQSIVISKNCPVYDEIKCEYPDIQLVEPKVNESFTSNVINKTKSMSIEEKRANIAVIQFEDPLVENICNSHGVYTYKDAANVKDVEGWFNETTIKSFKEFVYFTSVKELHRSTFEECVNLEHIVLPESITKIGNYAFEGCERLQEIHFPKNCTHIGRAAFKDCHSLKFVEIPENILSFGTYVFAYCKNLEKVIYKSNIDHIPPCMFEGTINLKEFKLLSSLCQSIGSSAFEYSGIEYIELPNNIIRIDTNAFYKSSLKNIKMDGVGTIWPSAFKKCQFETIRLPESLKEIGDYVFAQCPNLQNVYFLNNSEDDPIRSTGQSIFLDSDNIKNVYVNGKNESLVYYLLKLNFNRKKEHRYKLIDLNTNQEIKKRIYEDEPIDESFTSKVINNHKKIKQEEKREVVSEYVDLRLPSGNLWCKCNVGANSKEEFGNYYKHHEAVELSNNVDVLPTKDDFEELFKVDYCIEEWTNINGINGIMFTSKINGNTLFFPAGGCNPENNLQYNEVGNYWSETECYISENRSFYLKFDKDHFYTFHMHNANLFNVRMIKNNKIHESFTSNVIKKTKEKATNDKIKNTLNIEFEDPEVERICHEHGVYTYKDAENCLSIKDWFIDQHQIKKFNELKYFINIENNAIPRRCFDWCDSLEEVTLPENTKIIDEYAFVWCKSLKSIKIPYGCRSIMNHAFNNVRDLTDIYIPSTVERLPLTFNFLYECTNYGSYSLDFLTIHISPDYVYRKKIEKWNERYDFNIAYDY